MEKGTHHSKESKRKMSLAQTGKKLSKETKRRMSIANKGEKNNMYGIRKYGRDNHFYGKHHTEEAKRNMSIAKTGRKMKPFTDEHRRNLSLANIGKRLLDTKNRMKGNQYRQGIPHTEETKRNMSISRRGEDNNFYGKTHTDKWKKEHSGKNNHRYGKCGKLHPNWLGGKSFEPYGIAFNRQLKKSIRERDNNTCQVCKKHKIQLNRRLDVHHIDYIKTNNFTFNLISLCMVCHRTTNYNRTHWKTFFQNYLSDKYGYEYHESQLRLTDKLKTMEE